MRSPACYPGLSHLTEGFPAGRHCFSAALEQKSKAMDFICSVCLEKKKRKKTKKEKKIKKQRKGFVLLIHCHSYVVTEKQSG